jgi:hypothetical protein
VTPRTASHHQTYHVGVAFPGFWLHLSVKQKGKQLAVVSVFPLRPKQSQTLGDVPPLQHILAVSWDCVWTAFRP